MHPQTEPFMARPSDFLTGVAFVDNRGKSTPADPHCCLTGTGVNALVIHLASIGFQQVKVTKDYPEHGWPKDAPFTQSAQVPFLDIMMQGGQVIHVQAGEIAELYDGRYTPQLADYIVQQRCLRAAGN
jgi:hypothetical protein